jgi:hypothetical protein
MDLNSIFIGSLAVLMLLAFIWTLLRSVGGKRRLEPPRCGHCGTILRNGTWCPVCDREARGDTRSPDGHKHPERRNPTRV